MRCGVPKNGERHIDTFTLTNRVSGSRDTTHASTSRAYVAVGVKDRNTNLISRLISHCPHRFILPYHSDTEYHQHSQLGPSHLRFINPPAVRKHPIEQLAFYTSMHVCDGMSIEARCACNPQLFDATQTRCCPNDVAIPYEIYKVISASSSPFIIRKPLPNPPIQHLRPHRLNQIPIRPRTLRIPTISQRVLTRHNTHRTPLPSLLLF
jgi:hypothetical protein